jgi:endonuclease/exonuclease/phosphatase family metal-dependent hydrolase
VNEYIPTARPARVAGRLTAGLLMTLLVLTLLPTPGASAASVPTGLKATATTPTTMSLSWSAVAGAPKYRVKYSTKSSMTGATFHRYVGNQAKVVGLKPSTRYYAQVRVITAGGAVLSRYSKPIKVTTPSRPTLKRASVTSPLRVGSYNVRCANCFIGLPNELRWADRRGAVVSAIRNENLDVVGIQEASQGWLKDGNGRPIQLSQFEDLQQRLGSPWRLTNDKRNNCVRHTTPTRCQHKDQGASQGTRILYNSSRVEMLASGSKLLPSKGGLTNQRFLAWAVLRQRSTGVKFFFANSHLDADKSAYGLRKAEAQAAVQTIKARNSGHLPVIAVGDFNSSRFADPSNAPYDAYVKAGFTDPIGNGAKSTRAVDPTAERTSSTWLNSFNGFSRHAKGHRSWDNGSYIDYMLTTPMRVSEWETVARLDGNGNFVGTIPSDHNLVRMTVYLPR